MDEKHGCCNNRTTTEENVQVVVNDESCVRHGDLTRNVNSSRCFKILAYVIYGVPVH